MFRYCTRVVLEGGIRVAASSVDLPELISISMGYNALAFRDAMHTELVIRSGTVGRA